ncbi:MAG: hypothetical protein IPO73_05400 [Gemmatimonadetes bacterium]|nr:hypothetical protein [Gemmatimonadota bacterium]
MADAAPQSFQQHKRYVPGFHGVSFALVLLTCLLALAQVIRAPGLGTLGGLTGSLALLALFWYVRFFPLGVQDRVICLEEQLRMTRLLPADLAARAATLRPGQLIALRFASDAELPALVRRVLDEKVAGREEIKAMVTQWRADTRRI